MDNEGVCLTVLLHLYDRAMYKRHGPNVIVDPNHAKHDIGQFNTQQKNLLRNSWRAFIADDPAKTGFNMFLRMFKNEPKTKDFFSFARGSSLESMKASTALLFHTGRVIKYISMVIDNLDDINEAVPLLRQLGGRHGPGPNTFKVDESYFPHLGVAMRQLMKESGLLGWNSQLDGLWDKSYTWIHKRMEEGMKTYGEF